MLPQNIPYHEHCLYQLLFHCIVGIKQFEIFIKVSCKRSSSMMRACFRLGKNRTRKHVLVLKFREAYIYNIISGGLL